MPLVFYSKSFNSVTITFTLTPPLAFTKFNLSRNHLASKF